MSEKHLTELPWKTLATKQKIKDPGLGKALAAYGKAAETDYPARLEALEEIKTSAKKLKKEHASNKEVEEYLGEIVGETEKTGKALEVLQKRAAEKEEPDKGEDEEAKEYQKDLKAKLVSALAQVKSRAPGAPEPGEEAQPQLRFMAYLAGKACSVLIGKKVGSAGKKLLPDLAGGASGGKYLEGECIFEKGKHTFVVEQVPAGLAARLSQALLTETGQKYKVRVRSLDGTTELDSDSDTETETETEDTPGKTPVTPAGGYQTRVSALTPGLEAALSQRLGDTDKIRAVAAFMREKAAAGNYESALKAAAMLEKLLGEAGVATGGPTPGGEKVGFAKLRLEWDARKKAVAAQLAALRTSILAEYEDPESVEATTRLEKILARFSEGLGDSLDGLYTAADAGSAAPFRAKSLKIVGEYLTYVQADPLISHVEENPFLAVTVRETLAASLQAIQTELQRASA